MNSTDDGWQSPDEVEAQFEPGGAVDTAWQYVRAFYGHRWQPAWTLTDDTLRLALVQHWISNHDGRNFGNDDVARAGVGVVRAIVIPGAISQPCQYPVTDRVETVPPPIANGRSPKPGPRC